MKKLPAKWKFFLVVNYLLLISFGIILLALTIFVIKEKFSGNDLYTYFLVAAGFLSVCLNSFLNVYAVHHYFPDTLIPPKNQVLMKTIGIISILVYAGLVCLFIFGLTEEIAAANEPYQDKSGIYVLISLFFHLVPGIYTLTLQFGIFRFLHRNNAIKMSLLINSIGNE